MKKITYYVANDGKRFETEEDCMNYEFNKKLEIMKDDLVMYDAHERLEINYYSNFGEVYAFHCNSLSAVNFIKEWGKEEHMTTPFDDGNTRLGGYVWMLEQWWHLDDIIADFLTVKKEMEEKSETISLKLD